MTTNPKKILLFCGKRKSGKDYLTEWLQKSLNLKFEKNSTTILRLSGPLKECYAEDHGLDFSKLLDSSDYKEKYRKDMITWSEKIRNQNPSYFCLKAIQKYDKAKEFSIWIVSDCRRRTDFEFFDQNYPGKIVKIRVKASEETRIKRGFSFQNGIDDAESECGLDHEICDFELENNEILVPEELFKPILDLL